MNKHPAIQADEGQYTDLHSQQSEAYRGRYLITPFLFPPYLKGEIISGKTKLLRI
jgi:hypothetical protein